MCHNYLLYEFWKQCPPSFQEETTSVQLPIPIFMNLYEQKTSQVSSFILIKKDDIRMAIFLSPPGHLLILVILFFFVLYILSKF